MFFSTSWGLVQWHSSVCYRINYSMERRYINIQLSVAIWIVTRPNISNQIKPLNMYIFLKWSQFWITRLNLHSLVWHIETWYQGFCLFRTAVHVFIVTCETEACCVVILFWRLPASLDLPSSRVQCVVHYSLCMQMYILKHFHFNFSYNTLFFQKKKKKVMFLCQYPNWTSLSL